MDKLDLSIIIPIYNVEKYIVRCIESIIDIEGIKYEIILVNDGSKDMSGEICKKYVDIYDYVKYFEKENGGLSDARNFGFQKSKGEYVAFLDADDSVKKNSYAQIVRTAQKYDVEIINADAYLVYEPGEKLKRKTLPKSINGIVTGEEFLSKSIKEKTMSMCAPFSIVKRNFIIENNLFFKKGILHEDQLWSFQIYLSAKKVMYIDLLFYYHYQRADSIMNSKNTKKRCNDMIKICYALSDYFDIHVKNKKNLKIFKDYLVMLYLNAYNVGDLYNHKIDKFFLLRNAYFLRNRFKAYIAIISPVTYKKINKVLKRRSKN